MSRSARPKRSPDHLDKPVVSLVHPMWRPGDKGELLPVADALTDLVEHGGCAPLYVLLLEVVRRDDFIGDFLRDGRFRLDTDNFCGAGLIELGKASDAHVTWSRYADPGRALEPRVKQLDLVLSRACIFLVVWHPYGLERVHVAAAHTLEQGSDAQRLKQDAIVTKLVL